MNLFEKIYGPAYKHAIERMEAMSCNCNHHKERVRLRVPSSGLGHDMKRVLNHALDIREPEFYEYIHESEDSRWLHIVCRMDQFARLAIACLQFSAQTAAALAKFKVEIVPARDPANLDVSDR